jgi:eukaryotic-like serine/threonine-protein kinase
MSAESRKVAGYQLIASLGSGGMADVNLAVVSGVGGAQKLVVLKTMRSEHASDPEFKSMFLDEGRIASRLSHPNVVHTYEVGEIAGKIFIAMEHLDGQAYSAILARAGKGGLPLPLAVRILADALAGLHYAHELTDFDGTPFELVHRDVSPQNIFVTYQGHTKLLDFGIAKGGNWGNRTRTGVIKGKLGYMAPEQVSGHPLDRRADVFAVGVMLWELLAQTRLVSRRDEDIVVVTRRVEGSERGIRSAAPLAPEALLSICERAMALNPADRYASALELQEDLERYLATQTNCDARAVSTFLETLFREDRSEVRRVIEEAIRTAHESKPLISVAPPAHAVVSTSVVVPIHTMVDPVPQPAKQARFGFVKFGAFAAIGLIMALGWWVVKLKSMPRSDSSTPNLSAPSAALPEGASVSTLALATPPTGDSPTSQAAARASVEPASGVGQFRIRVSADPKSAQVMVDRAIVDNPYIASLSAGPHVIRAELPGFKVLERTISVTADSSVELSLERVSPTNAVVAAPPGPSTAAGKKPRFKIDDADPYK